jgi:hypothetical protein
VTPLDALALIVERCPELAPQAAVGLRSSTPHLRVQALLSRALAEGEWTADERAGLVAAATGTEAADRKTRQINIRLSPAEYDRLALAAEDAGISISDFLRGAIPATEADDL